MKKNLKYIRIIVVIFLSAGLFSCTSFVEGLRPTDRLTTLEVFTDGGTAEAAVVGIYTQQMTNHLTFFNVMGTVGAVSSDDLVINGGGSSSSFVPFFQNAIPIDNGRNTSIWRDAYVTIYQCNSVIESLGASENLDISLTTRLEAEARFLRALLFFYMTNLYGDIPMPLTSNYTINAELARESEDMVYRQILSDLDHAYTGLGADHVSAGRIRATKAAAAALWARIYLHLQDWTKAQESADLVLDDNRYELDPADRNFQKESKEIILGVLPASSQIFGTGDGYIFLPSSTTSIPSFSLSSELVTSFEPGDLRKSNWLGINTVNGVSYYYPRKYKIRTASGPDKGETNIVLRLAEIYLIKAEALAQQGDIDGGIAALDHIRERAGLPRLAETNPGISQVDLLSVIYHEKRIEYFAEWAHRWLDLKRLGMAGEILGASKPGWKPNAVLFPIPWAEIEVSPFLKQNLGYPESI